MSRGETWLVTGARGFLGRHVLRALAERPDIERVLTLDRRRPATTGGLVADLGAGPPDLGPLLTDDHSEEAGGDAGDTETDSAAPAIDVVVHLAGLAHRLASAAEYRRSHLRGTQNLLTALDRLGPPPRAVVFASSVAVYGRREGGLLPEETPIAPVSNYGAAKADAEAVLTTWAERRRVEAAVLRLPLLVGRQAPGNLGRMLRALERHRYVSVGPGSARRSMVLAEDVAALLPRASRHGGTYHLTDRHHPSFRELEEALCRALGRDLPPRIPLRTARLAARLGDFATRLSEPLTGRRAPFDSAVYERMTSTLTFDDDKAVRRLGWAPRAVLEETERWIGDSSY